MKYVFFVLSIVFAGVTAVDAHALTVRCTDPQAMRATHIRMAISAQQAQRHANGQFAMATPTQAPNIAQRDQRRDARYAPQPTRRGSSIRVCNN